MTLRHTLLFGTALTFCALDAYGQPVQQTGSVTPGHAASWTTTGIVQDAGVSTAGKITTLGITSSALQAFGINDALITSGGYHEFTVGVAPLLGYMEQSLQSIGTATCIPWIFEIGTIGAITIACSGQVTIPALAATAGVNSVMAGPGLTGTPNPIVSTGTISLAAVAPGLVGNSGTASAVPTGVAVGAGLTLTAGGTLNSTVTGGTVTSVTAGTGLTATATNPITASGTIAIAPTPAGQMLANITGATNSPTGVTGTAFLDNNFGSAVGYNLQRTSGGWAQVLATPAGTTANLLGATGTAGAAVLVTVANGVSLAGGTLGLSSLTGMVSVPLGGLGSVVTAGTMYLAIGIPWVSDTINSMSVLSTGTGTFTAAFAIGGATITSCGSVNSATSLVVTGCTGANVLSSTSLFTLVISNVSGTASLASVQFTHTHSVP